MHTYNCNVKKKLGIGLVSVHGFHYLKFQNVISNGTILIVSVHFHLFVDALIKIKWKSHLQGVDGSSRLTFNILTLLEFFAVSPCAVMLEPFSDQKENVVTFLALKSVHDQGHISLS